MSYYFQDFETEYRVIPLDRNDVQSRKVSVDFMSETYSNLYFHLINA